MKLRPLTRLKARATFFARLCGVALVLPSLAACVVPIPSSFAGPYTYKEVPDSVIQAIEPRTTTRAETSSCGFPNLGSGAWETATSSNGGWRTWEG